MFSVYSFLREIDSEFTPLTYDLVNWNCNHFSDVCSRFLLNNEGIPRAILRQPQRVSRSWVGRIILGSLLIAQENQNPFRIEALDRKKGDGSYSSSTVATVSGSASIRETILSFRPPELVQLEAERIRACNNSRQQDSSPCTCSSTDCDPFRWFNWLKRSIS